MRRDTRRKAFATYCELGLSSALLSHPHCLGVPYLPSVNVAMAILGKKQFT